MGPPPNGRADPSSPSNKPTKMRANPANAWADIQDNQHGVYDKDLQALWGKQQTNMDFNSPVPKPGMKGGKQGKGGGKDDGKGMLRGPPQDMHNQQSKWVPTQP